MQCGSAVNFTLYIELAHSDATAAAQLTNGWELADVEPEQAEEARAAVVVAEVGLSVLVARMKLLASSSHLLTFSAGV